MVHHEQNPERYIIVSGEEYKKRTTNFYFKEEEGLVFNQDTHKIYHEKTKQTFSLNELVQILVQNHLSDRERWKRKKNYLANALLKVVFWLSDKHYERVQVMLDLHRLNPKREHDKGDEKNIEPFFKYFLIPRNTLFAFLLLAFPVSISMYLLSGIDLSLSNSVIVLFFFLLLFILEKVSIGLDGKIKKFFDKENNFISRVHKYQFQNKFTLKLNKPTLKN